MRSPRCSASCAPSPWSQPSPRRSGVFFALLSVAVALSSLPALRGTLVYDDLLMVGHPRMNHLGDLARALSLNSNHYISSYLGAGHVNNPAPTWRPLPMASMIAVNALFGVSPTLHHLASLGFHLAALALLLSCLARDHRASGRAMLMVSVFALHPALGEAWHWINGRSDVMAGALLLALARCLMAPPSRLRTFGSLAILVAGALCKETFLVASLCLLVAEIVELPKAERAWLRSLGPWAITVGVFFLGRGLSLRGSQLVAPDGYARGLMDIVLSCAPRLIALGTRTLMVPLPEPMRLLAWDFRSAPTLVELCPLGLFALALILLARARRYGPMARVLGAAATLLPTALVSNSYWLGFNRYLYLPACLLCLAARPWALAQPTPEVKAWKPALSALALCALALANHHAAGYFRSDHGFQWAILRERPEEPTGYLLVAEQYYNWRNNTLALRVLRWMPQDPDTPRILALRHARLLRALGEPEQASSVMGQSNRARPAHTSTPTRP